MSEPRTEAGKRLAYGSLADMIAAYGEGWTKVDAILAIEAEAGDLMAALSEAGAAIKAALDDDGFGLEIAYWEDFPDSPWAVSTTGFLAVTAKTLPEALRALVDRLRERGQ